jgi:D-alanyl-D-alanine carboxypeptidase
MASSKHFNELGIPRDYGKIPRLPRYPEATRLEEVEPNVVGRMQRLAPESASDWRAMKKAALDDSIELLMVSGFRSVDDQAEIIRRKLAAGLDIGAILAVNAAPGFSQHHTGHAIDIATRGSRPLMEEFEGTAAFAWLKDHARAFGFSMPYGRANAFGLAYEPWHWSQLP